MLVDSRDGQGYQTATGSFTGRPGWVFLAMSVTIAATSSRASAYLNEQVAVRERGGFLFSRPDAELGDEAMVGRRTAEFPDSPVPQLETVRLMVRNGRIVIETSWTSPPENPNYENALEVTNILLARRSPPPDALPAAMSEGSSTAASRISPVPSRNASPGQPPSAGGSQLGTDPVQYLPPSRELPSTLQHQPDRDRREEGEGYTTAFQAYFRPEGANGPKAQLEMSAAWAESEQRASVLYRGAVQYFQDLGFSFGAMASRLGDESTVGRRAGIAETGPEFEAIAIVFRAGRLVPFVAWTGSPGEPNYENAVEIAKLIEDRSPARTPTARSDAPTNPGASGNAIGRNSPCDRSTVSPPRQVDVQITSHAARTSLGTEVLMSGTVTNNSFDWAATGVEVTLPDTRKATVGRQTLEPGGTTWWQGMVGANYVTYTPQVTWTWLPASCLGQQNR